MIRARVQRDLIDNFEIAQLPAMIKFYRLSKLKGIFKYLLHRRNNFVKVSKNLVRYRSENNFVGLLK